MSPLLLAAALGALVSACADPSQSFDDFVERRPPPPPPGACPEAYAMPAVGAMDGDYFMTLATSANVDKPIANLVTVTTEDQGGTLAMAWTIQALNKTDWTAPEGDPLPVAAVPVGDDGTFTIDIADLTIPPAANCLIGFPATAQIVFNGNVCGDGSFMCGDATGSAHAGTVDVDLLGTTWTMQRITDPANYPKALLDCKQTEYTAGLCGPTM